MPTRPFGLFDPALGAATTTYQATWRALSSPSGNVNLSDTLTVNSASVTPMFSYRGENAGASTWTSVVGPSLAIASSGTAPTRNRPTPFTQPGELAVKPAGSGQVYQAGTTTDQIGTEDFAIELVCRVSTARGAICAQRTNAGTTGWGLLYTGTTLALSMGDGTFQNVFNLAVTADLWSHLMIFVDRNDTSGARLYLNGVLVASTDPTAHQGSLNGSQPFTVGSFSDFNERIWNGDIASIRVWKQSGWFAGGATNTTQMAAAAKARAAALWGITPSLVTGSPTTPTTMTRSTSAYMDRIISSGPTVRQLFQVSANAPRFVKRESANGASQMSGLIREPQATNLALQSETIDNASWTKVNATITANATAAPNGDTTADALVAASGSANHGITQAATLTAAPWVLSVWAKAGGMGKLVLGNTTIANGLAWFDLGAGTVGTVQSGIAEALISPFGNGWFRCSVRFTGTAASHTIGAWVATADGTQASTGDGTTVSTYLWGFQLEASNDGRASSYIPTTTAQVTRTADTIEYDISGGSFPSTGSQFQISVDLLGHNFDLQSAWTAAWISATSANANNAESLGITSGDAATAAMSVGGSTTVALTGAADVADGQPHTLALEVTGTNSVLTVDGVTVGAGSGSATTSSQTYLSVGAFTGGTNASGSFLIGTIELRKANP